MNPFRQVYDAAIKRGDSEYEAIICAKESYADHVRLLVGDYFDYSSSFIVDRLREYTRMLDEVIAP